MVTVLGVPSNGRDHRTATARPPHGHAADLGQDEEAIIAPRAVAILLVGEGMGAVAALKAREPRLFSIQEAAEEGVIGLVQPGQHILQPMGLWMAAYSGISTRRSFNSASWL
jgi:hypothetical protein